MCCLDKVQFFPMTIIFVVRMSLEFSVFLLGESTNFAGFWAGEVVFLQSLLRGVHDVTTPHLSLFMRGWHWSAEYQWNYQRWKTFSQQLCRSLCICLHTVWRWPKKVNQTEHKYNWGEKSSNLKESSIDKPHICIHLGSQLLLLWIAHIYTADSLR